MTTPFFYKNEKNAGKELKIYSKIPRISLENRDSHVHFNFHVAQ